MSETPQPSSGKGGRGAHLAKAPAAARPARATTSQGLFRAQALRTLDVAVEIDNQLPLVSRRTWLVVVGVVVIAAAGILWAALTPSLTSVTGTGRIVSPEGVVPITTMAAGTVAGSAPASGSAVTDGEEVASVMTMSGNVPVTSMTNGTLWQQLAPVGTGLPEGGTVATVLPVGSDRSALIAIPEARAGSIRVGQTVTMQGGSIMGVVSAVAAPLPASLVSEQIALPLDPSSYYVAVTVTLDAPAQPGTEVDASIILTSESILRALLSRS